MTEQEARRWSPAAKWGATSLIAMMAAVAVLAGDHYRVLDRIQARDFTFPQQWAVAEVHPEFGEGIPSELGEARIAEDGTLQVLSSGGGCEALAGVEVEESDETVRVIVRRADVPVPACTADISSWFAAIPLDGPLGNREVISPRTGATMAVADCTVEPAPTKGICAVEPWAQ
jgi:hypothetical protein